MLALCRVLPQSSSSICRRVCLVTHILESMLVASSICLGCCAYCLSQGAVCLPFWRVISCEMTVWLVGVCRLDGVCCHGSSLHSCDTTQVRLWPQPNCKRNQFAVFWWIFHESLYSIEWRAPKVMQGVNKARQPVKAYLLSLDSLYYVGLCSSMYCSATCVVKIMAASAAALQLQPRLSCLLMCILLPLLVLCILSLVYETVFPMLGQPLPDGIAFHHVTWWPEGGEAGTGGQPVLGEMHCQVLWVSVSIFSDSWFVVSHSKHLLMILRLVYY